MQIIRDQLENSLFEFINSDNGIIIGPPGIGKTHLLNQIRLRFEEQNIPNLYLPIDKFDIESNQDLEILFHFKGDFIDVLFNQPEVRNTKGFFIIDSFDSAKSEKSKKFFLNLIERVKRQLKDKWQIVVSVRTFDAKKSQKLLELFPQSAEEEKIEFQSDDIHCRHFLIPKLTDAEVKRALKEIIGSRKVSKISNFDIWDLLKIPFNLWLLEQVASTDNSIVELQKIRSQVELLELFWRKRIHDTPSWEEKEIILRFATRTMVATKKLFVGIDKIYQSDKKDAWQCLLSDQILVETSKTGQNVAFSHNILFDYAVSILLLEESENAFITFITEDKSRQLFLRPSLDFYFTRLLHSNPNQFWRTFWKILQSEEVHLTILVRLTLINVIINEIRDIDSLQPIYDQLQKGHPQGIKATLYLLQALDALNIENDKIWIKFLERIEGYQNFEFVGIFAWTVSKIVERTSKKDDQDLFGQCGKISRNLLKWIIAERAKKRSDFIDGVGANLIVPVVAKTFVSDPMQSAELLRDVLAIKNEPDFPIMYIYKLVEELGYIWLYDTEFVELVYLTVLSYIETSTTKTSMGTPVLPLLSNRRQDYEMCYYSLAKQYPKFLIDNPLAATKVAIIALNNYIIQNEVIPFINDGYSLDDLNVKFIVKQKEISVYSDHCIGWDTSGYTREPIKIADELFKYVDIKAEQKDRAFIDNLLKIFYENVRVMFFWRRLLISAAKHPEIFAPKLFDLSITEPILTSPETIHETAEFIQKSSTFFSKKQLLQIERSIINITKQGTIDSESHEYLERKRDRLLARIPKERLQTKEGRDIRNSMEKRQNIPSNEPLITWEGGIKEFTEEDSLKEQGIDLSQEPNKMLFQLLGPLKDFSTRWMNKNPDSESIKKILPSLKKTFQLLEEQQSANIKVKNSAWTHLASCVSLICDGIDPSDIESLNFCQDILLRCASHPEPVYDPKYHFTFDYPSWSLEPRNEAALGLPKLASVKSEQRIIDNIRKLAIEDQVPSVRYLAISRLLWLWKSNPEFVWEVLEDVVKNENNQVILNAACRDIGRIWSPDSKRAEVLLDRLFDKTFIKGKPDQSNPLPSIIVELGIVRQNSWATATFEKITNRPEKFSKHYGYFVFALSKYINPKFTNFSFNSNYQLQAVRMLEKIVTSSQSGILSLISEFEEIKKPDTQTHLNELYLIIHEVVMRLFFAIEEYRSNSDKGLVLGTEKERRDFYFNFKPLLEKIIDFSITHNSFNFNARTIYYLIKLFNEVIEFDPKYVIHSVANLIKNNEIANYSLDPLATDEILKFGEKIIADHKDVLQDDIVINDFIIIIDSFVKNRNQKMMNFVWRLDEVYR